LFEFLLLELQKINVLYASLTTMLNAKNHITTIASFICK